MAGIDWKHLLFAFDGRITRKQFGLGVLVLLLFAQVAFGVLMFLVVENVAIELALILLGVVFLGLLWPGLALLIKRWHDRDKSGWWMLIGLVPTIGILWILIETGLLPGTDGDNRYGPKPFAN